MIGRELGGRDSDLAALHGKILLYYASVFVMPYVFSDFQRSLKLLYTLQSFLVVRFSLVSISEYLSQ